MTKLFDSYSLVFRNKLSFLLDSFWMPDFFAVLATSICWGKCPNRFGRPEIYENVNFNLENHLNLQSQCLPFFINFVDNGLRRLLSICFDIELASGQALNSISQQFYEILTA